MKAFRFITCLILMLSIGCINFSYAMAAKENGWGVIHISSDFSIREKSIIRSAIGRFNRDIGCVQLVEVEEVDTIKSAKVLEIEKGKYNDKYLGKYNYPTNTIYLFISNETKLYKTTLHELAHAIGMRGHYSENEFNSLLAPYISIYSPLTYSVEDVKYLKSITCK